MTVSEKMFITVTSFVFGCLFELFKPKNPRDEINDFFKVILENIAFSVVFDEKIRRSENQ